jgi:hypothetical protein
MADNMTGTGGGNGGGGDRAAGFGATTQTSKNSEEIRRLLEQARDLLIEDGVDPATAEAQIGFAMPAMPSVSGNLADLHRMGQVVVQGRIDTPVGQRDIVTSDINEAFHNPQPPPGPNPATGLQTPLGQVDAEGRPTGAVEEGVAAPDDSGGDGGSDYGSMTKAELQAEADERGIAYTSSDTKADLIAKLEE